jgi:hypothetical protein
MDGRPFYVHPQKLEQQNIHRKNGYYEYFTYQIRTGNVGTEIDGFRFQVRYRNPISKIEREGNGYH